MKMLLFILSLIILGCSPATIKKAEKPVAIEAPVELTIDWQLFDDDLIKISYALNKPIFLYLKCKKCKHCQKMEKITLSNQIVVREINRKFIASSIDVGKDPEAVSIFYDEDTIIVPKIIFIQPRNDKPWIVAKFTGYMNPFEIINTIIKVNEFFKKQQNKSGSEESAGEY